MNLKYRRILCAVNLSDTTDCLYRYALKKAGEDNAKILFFHVISRKSINIDKTMTYLFDSGAPADTTEEGDIIKKKVGSALQHMKNQLTFFFESEFKDHPEYVNYVEFLVVHHGDVAEEIATKAYLFGCQAIVIGAHGKGLLKPIFPCAITKRILKRSHIPVLRVTMT